MLFQCVVRVGHWPNPHSSLKLDSHRWGAIDMKGNDAFRESQRAADEKSKSKAQQIIKDSDLAAHYIDTIRATTSPDKSENSRKRK
jgi:hypothetical protein